ncbi:MAG: hypothetical protein CME69_01385 [Halobacteriovorax sp.]|nr:hypothetical protein [Halobacteriovorax sp.]|tara:strand:+ start:965 stop:1699 length:735 start_codon:yes stop_codon:yes gene_type:complete
MLEIITLTTLLNTNFDKTLCHEKDQRVSSDKTPIARALPSKNGKIGRRGPTACTATMISKDCAVSAGHCFKNLNFIEFNVPPTINLKNLGHPDEEDIYRVNRKTIIHKSNGPGDDWAVFKVLPNQVTSKYPGDVMGFLEVDFNKPSPSFLEVTGYGADHSPISAHFTQQTDQGELISIEGSRIGHTVDTMGGNSGSSIIDLSTGKIIGIHTHAGCSISPGFNQGTSIFANNELMNAIKFCLKSD